MTTSLFLVCIGIIFTFLGIYVYFESWSSWGSFLGVLIFFFGIFVLSRYSAAKNFEMEIIKTEESRIESIHNIHNEEVDSIEKIFNGEEPYYLVTLENGRILEYTYVKERVVFRKERPYFEQESNEEIADTKVEKE